MPNRFERGSAMWLVRCVSVAFLTVSAAHSACGQEEAPSVEAPVQAIWKQQEIPFYFQSFTTMYSCSSLEAKIRRVLVALGASRELKLRSRGCLSPHEISRMPYVEITIATPVEATPEALAELDKTRSTRELAARVRGDSKQAVLDAAQFPAHWKRVSLARGKLYLEPGDCELIKQLQQKVLPMLAVRIVGDEVQCTPNQLSAKQPRLIVEALLPMPKPDESARTEKTH
jgi:hypothetical protein